MEKRSYSYGMKITGVLLHSFFTIVLTVSVFLLASLVSKNILELTDIGTDDFLSSGYYLKCMEQKCNDLNDYLLLTQKGALRTAEDEKRYLQYTNEFKQESTNFCYWYKINGVWYTNQPDTREGRSSYADGSHGGKRPWEIICFTIWKTRNLARYPGTGELFFQQ